MTDLDVVTWNVCVENDADTIQAGLAELAKARPHVIVLQECYHVRPSLPGYVAIQEPRHPDVGGLVNEDADVAVLVREDVTIRRQSVVRMLKAWVGPKAGKRHAPRVFRKLVLKVDGTVWKVAGVHFVYPTPENGAAVAEHKRWAARFLRGVRPAVIVGDQNQHASIVRGRRSTGMGPDRAILARCVGASRQIKAMYGSDHHPVSLRISA